MHARAQRDATLPEEGGGGGICAAYRLFLFLCEEGGRELCLNSLKYVGLLRRRVAHFATSILFFEYGDFESPYMYTSVAMFSSVALHSVAILKFLFSQKF